MRFAFTEEQILFRDSVRGLLDKACAPSALRAAWESDDGAVPELWEKLAELGITAMSISEEAGGLGMGPLDWILVFEEAGRVGVPGPLAETVAVGAPLLEDLGSTSCNSILEEVAAGTTQLTVRLGSTEFVAHADSTKLALLQHGHSLYALPHNALDLVPQESVDGSRRLFRAIWNQHEEHLIAQGPKATEAMNRALDRGVLACSGQLLGLASRMLDMTVEYAKVREQFGKPIGTFQAIKHHLVDALVALEFARPIVYRAAWSLAEGTPDATTHASMAKLYASRAADIASRKALQVHGAIGYSFEYDLQLYMKRAWALQRAWGDNAWHRERIAAAVLDH